MDEVSFKEGDLIFEIDPIDAGWMTGKVERTGKTGMLPANYLQPAMIQFSHFFSQFPMKNIIEPINSYYKYLIKSLKDPNWKSPQIEQSARS